MSEVIHVKVLQENTLVLPLPISTIFKDREIPEELDIVIIDKKPQEYVDKILGCFDFDDELLDKVSQLEMEQWLID